MLPCDVCLLHRMSLLTLKEKVEQRASVKHLMQLSRVKTSHPKFYLTKMDMNVRLLSLRHGQQIFQLTVPSAYMYSVTHS